MCALKTRKHRQEKLKKSNEWREMKRLVIERLDMVKMVIFLLIYGFNTISKSPQAFFLN